MREGGRNRGILRQYYWTALDHAAHAPQQFVTAACAFVGSCLATKVFIDNLPAMGRGWVIIK